MEPGGAAGLSAEAREGGTRHQRRHVCRKAAGDYNRIGSYWERGHQNEIDLVAINDMKKTITIADVKLNRSKLNEKGLKYRAQGLLTSYPLHHPKWLGLSVENMADYRCKSG